MLYLFGRLALSDSYYFNDDFHADEFPENPPRRPAPATASRPVAAEGVGGHESHALTCAKKPAAESSNGLL